jgi:hypothetical protein
MLYVPIQRDLERWRAAARSLLVREVEPPDVFWDDGSAGGDGRPSLLVGETFVADGPAAEQSGECSSSSRTVPAAFFDAARVTATRAAGL